VQSSQQSRKPSPLARDRPRSAVLGPTFVQSRWNAKEIHIPDNGRATHDILADDGKVYDTDRSMFLRT
jgi:beta-glucosidase